MTVNGSIERPLGSARAVSRTHRIETACFSIYMFNLVVPFLYTPFLYTDQPLHSLLPNNLVNEACMLCIVVSIIRC